MREKNKYEVENDPARIGCFTASSIYRAMRGAAGRATYVSEVATARRNGQFLRGGGSSAATRWGDENEPVALDLHEKACGQKILDMRFTKHAWLPYFGASPDGLYEDESKIIEVKCPYNGTYHTEVLRKGVDGIKPEYIAQMTAQVLVYNSILGITSCDFVCYDPDGKPPLEVVEFTPSDEQINDMTNLIFALNAEVEQINEEIEQRLKEKQ